MSSPAARRSPWIERAVLGSALLSTGLLLWAASSAMADPERASQAVLIEIETEVTRDLRSTWERLRSISKRSVFTGDLRWREDPGPAAQPIEEGPGTPSALGFDLDLLSADAALSPAGDSPPDLLGARAWLSTALGRPHVDGTRRGRGWLRAVQLAVRAEDCEQARQLWLDAANELSGMETFEGTSSKLLIALAVAPCLSEADRTDLEQELRQAWRTGNLALPGDQPSWVATVEGVHFQEHPRVQVLLNAIEALSPASPGDGEPNWTTVRELRSLKAHLGELPTPSESQYLSFRETSLGLLVVGQDESGYAAGWWTPAKVVDLLNGLMRANPRWGEFHFHLDGEKHPGGYAIQVPFTVWKVGDLGRRLLATRVPLNGAPFHVNVSHPDVVSLVHGERREALLLRWGLLGSALMIALAGFATFAAMRRERNLQAMRVDFIAGVSHELRTPLASILLMAENLEEGRVPPARAKRYHASLRGEATRLRRLVDDVLDFSRLERGRPLELHRSEVDLEVWLQQVESHWRSRAEMSPGSIRFLRHSCPAQVWMDGDSIRRVIDNLLDNAFKYGGGQVELHAFDDPESFRLEVCDRGPGVPSRDLQRIFEAFLRLDDGSQSNRSGTGLGLAIAKQTVEAHGGLLIASEGRDGVGLRMCVTLPKERHDG